jgi:hypothetical protein
LREIVQSPNPKSMCQCITHWTIISSVGRRYIDNFQGIKRKGIAL